MAAYAGYVRGGGPAGLAASLALARRGRVLIELRRVDNDTARVDSLPMPLLALLIELGIHPGEIGVSAPSSVVLTSWEDAGPCARDVAPKVHVDRRRLERALLRQVERNPQIAIVDKGEVEELPALCVDATGRRALTAQAIMEPPSPWFARTVVVPGIFSPAQQAVRIAPFPEGYVYRIASQDSATVGIVRPENLNAQPGHLFDMIRDAGCGWTLSGLDKEACRPGRGGKASVQRSVPSAGWVAVGDASFACDALSSQGVATGMSAAMKVAGSVPADQGTSYRRHVGHLADSIARNRFREARVWQTYMAFLEREYGPGRLGVNS